MCEQSPSNAVNQLGLYQNDRFISNIPFNFNDFEHCFSLDGMRTQNIVKIQATENGVSW